MYCAPPCQLNDPCEYYYQIGVPNPIDRALVVKNARELFKYMRPSDALQRANPGTDIKGIIAMMQSIDAERLADLIILGAQSMPPERYATMMEANIALDKETIGLCCFSEAGESPYMSWHYASQHTGVCLEFATSRDPFRELVRVEYSEKVPILNAFAHPQENLVARMQTKSLEWRQEREWRMFAYLKPDEPETMFRSFDPKALLSVSFAPDAGTSTRAVVYNMLRENREADRTVAIYNLVKTRMTYTMERRQIDEITTKPVPYGPRSR
jgi:hypothetical protein